jgi:hypothetical protein
VSDIPVASERSLQYSTKRAQAMAHGVPLRPACNSSATLENRAVARSEPYLGTPISALANFAF